MQAILQTNNNIWDVECPLDFKNICDLEKTSNRMRKILTKELWQINLSKVNNIDSSGIAWILENIRYAKIKDIALDIQGFNLKKGHDLASIQGVLKIINKYIK